MWLQLTLDAAGHDPELLSDLLHESGAAAVTLQDAADDPVLEPAPGETTLWSHTAVTGLYTADTDPEQILAFVRQQLDGAELVYHTTLLQDQDWERAWMDHFHPMRFGRRLWVCPHWRTPPEPKAVNVMLDPGLAFGTGTHPTTALCLEWLDSADLAGKTLIDFGCGSGILAIAAAKLGGARVWAIDHDPQALQATRANAAANDVLDCIETLLPEQLPNLQADIVLANILAGPLLALAPHFAELTQPGGVVVLSGILAPQAQALVDKYCTWFNMEPPMERDSWVRLTGQRL